MGSIAQSVTCLTALTADMCLNADPVVTSSIPACSHTFAEIDSKFISNTLAFVT